MAIMAMDTKAKTLLFIIAVTLTSKICLAGDFTLKSSVNIEETYSDNLELTSIDEISGVVTQTGVDITSTYKAQNASLNLQSQSTYASYSHDHEIDNDYHTLKADSQILLWPNGITLTANASIRNQPKNSARNANSSVVSGDLIQTEQYGTGLQYQINNRNYSLTTSAGYRTSKSEDGIGEKEGVNFSISSNNGAAAKNVFWDSSASYSQNTNNERDTKQHRTEIKLGLITRFDFTPFVRYYDEDNGNNANRNNSSLQTNSYGLGFRWKPFIRFIIDISYNEPIDDTLDSVDEEQKAYLDISINWQPSSRTQIQASHSQRFFGNSYGLNISHKNRRLTNTILYNEQVQSFTRDNYQLVTSTFLCQNPDAIDLNDCFVQSGDNFNPEDSTTITVNNLEVIEDNDYWLNKTLAWSSTLTLPKTNFSINFNHSVRENLNTGSQNKTKTISTRANRTLSPNSNIALTASYSERDYDNISNSGQNDKYRRYGINFSHSISSNLNFNVDLHNINRSSNNESYNYSENRISLRLTKDF